MLAEDSEKEDKTEEETEGSRVLGLRSRQPLTNFGSRLMFGLPRRLESWTFC